MKIHKISIKNILGVEALDFTPGAITRITGGNGVGKTSVLEALKAVCKGGHDATLLRTGQQKGEIVIELEGGLQVSKRVTEKGAYLTVTKDGAKVDKPAEFLKGLWDSLSANPIEFMLADKRKRVDWLLEQIDPAPVMKKLAAIHRVDDADNALAAMDAARKSLFDERTEANRTERRARETAETLAADLPAESDDIAAELAEAIAEHQGYDMGLKAEIERAREATQDRLKEIGDEERAELDALHKQIDAARLKFQNLASEARQDLEAAIEGLRAETQPKIDAAAAEVAKLQQAQRTADEAVGRRKLLAKTKGEAEAAKERSTALTAKIAEVDALKSEVLGKLPIPGIAVVDGEIQRDGVPFDRLNTATQWQIAINIAKLRAGEIPLICADGLEALDDANFAAFSSMAADSGLHFIVTDRGNGPLAIDADGKRTKEAT